MQKPETENHQGFEDWQQRAITLAASGDTRKNIAEQVEKSLPTLRCFLRSPEASKAIRHIRNDRFDELQNRLSTDFREVLDAVKQLLASEDENVILKAAQWLRQVLFDGRNIDVQTELAELTERLEGLSNE